MTVYVSLPQNLIAVPRYPGYFWDTVEHKLYSIKIGGVLRELPRQKYCGMTQHGPIDVDGYRVSRAGWRRTISFQHLVSLKPTTSEVPFA